jgi:5-methylcytosine-specific restriction endonuclease McrA
MINDFDWTTRAEYVAHAARLRVQSLKEAGGKHTRSELQEILVLQEYRCIYCNVLFTDSVRPTRDHLVPVWYGGSDWALNIVIACRRCNCRREKIPFRTYCRLLSPMQNRRIVRHLARRIEAMDFENLPREAFASFHEGLELQEPRNGRYRRFLRASPTRRYYAGINRKVIRRWPQLIFDAAFSGAHRIRKDQK